jgi:hypothetical protein
MINKRLLIKNLLTYHGENSFFDKKRQLNLHSQEGKGKFLKHICALSNANPFNNAYIIVGVEDDNEITGDDFFDDSKIQNLVNAFLDNPPFIIYDNVPFPSNPIKKSRFSKNQSTISRLTPFIIEQAVILHQWRSYQKPLFKINLLLLILKKIQLTH